MLNFLLAIIIEAYGRVKEDIQVCAASCLQAHAACCE
jgi:hypothetical protein